MVSTTRFL